MHRNYTYLITLTIFLLSLSANAENSIPCENKFDNFLRDNSNLSMPEKINSWKSQENDCKPKGYYYYSLSKLYNSVENIKEAKQNILRGLKYRDSAYKLNKLMALSVEFTELSFKPLKDSGWPKLEKKIISFTEKHPKLTDTYTLLSSVKLARGDYEGAIQFAGKSAYLEGGLSLQTGRTLTIAYTETGKYKQALEVGNGVTKLHNELFLDKYFMLAVVRSYVGNRDVDMASRVLKLLVARNKKLINDSDVQKYARFLQNALKARENK